jgi:hypothetical protein
VEVLPSDFFTLSRRGYGHMWPYRLPRASVARPVGHAGRSTEDLVFKGELPDIDGFSARFASGSGERPKS